MKYQLNKPLFGLEKGTEITPWGEVVSKPVSIEDFSITRTYTPIKICTAFEVYLLLKDGAISEVGNLRDNSDGSCNCKPLGSGCFFTSGAEGGQCDCKCHQRETKTSSCSHTFSGDSVVWLDNEYAKCSACKEVLPVEEKTERWKPVRGEYYFYISESGNTQEAKNILSLHDDALIEIGNCFKTKEEAQDKLPEFLAVFKK